MDRPPSNREPLKVTSYAEFLQKMKITKVDKPGSQTPRPQTMKIAAQIKKPYECVKQTKKQKINVKCTTEASPLNARAIKNGIDDHFRSKDSNTHTFNQSQAYISIQNDCDWEISTSHPNKENTFTQPKSCSRLKHNISYEQPSYCEPQTQSDELASYMLNQILLIVREITKFNRQRITYLDYLQILRQLNMIQNSYEPSKDDIVFKLWELLVAGNKENTTCLINLSIIILAVMNTSVKIRTVKEFFCEVCYAVDGIKSTNACVKRTQSRTTKQYKRNKQGFFDLSEQDIAQINRTFKQLRVTRIFLGRIHKKSEMMEQRAERYKSHSFKPYISNKSRSLAKKKRTKNSENSHYQSTLGNQTAQCQTQRDRKQTEGGESTYRNTNSSISEVGMKRSQILYSMAKSKSKQKRDRKKDEIEFQNNEIMYTFKPSVLPYNKSMERKKQNVAGENKEVNRMLKARLEKEVVEAASAKGIPYNAKQFNKLRKKINIELNQQSLTKKISDKVQQETPQLKNKPDLDTQQLSQQNQRKEIFTFEVYLQEDVRLDKITIYEGDNTDIVAQQFVSKHKLKPQMYTKLAKSLQNHLARLHEADRLGKIQEESAQQSFEV